MIPVALTIAGSDPSGGAGIQADLKTFHRFQVYGEAVPTLLTVQNTRTVEAVEVLRPALVMAQLRAVWEDIPPHAAKTGALGSEEIVQAVAEAAASFPFPLVVDPVMISKHGARLISREARDALVRFLLPRAFLLTPNLAEATELTGIAIQNVADMGEAARKLVDLGAQAVLVKGGHLPGHQAVDVLLAGGTLHEFPAPRMETPHTHGTGCTYSAAITALLARGETLLAAVEQAKAFITRAIQTNPGLGHGSGPLNHWA